MKTDSSKVTRILGLITLCALVSLLTWLLTRQSGHPPEHAAPQDPPGQSGEQADSRLVRQLLEEDLGDRRFDFPTIVFATSERRVIPLDENRESHVRVVAAIGKALDESTEELSRTDSPIRQLRRINEGSRYFEEALMQKLDARDDLDCEIPKTRDGDHQRSGYPDLKVTDRKTGEVFYLDPKLVEQSSWKSSFRTFYFEPKTKTLKINDDAVHLLVGIGHDGKSRAWTFGEWKIVDLSTLRVRLKAEFQASNADLYRSDDRN